MTALKHLKPQGRFTDDKHFGMPIAGSALQTLHAWYSKCVSVGGHCQPKWEEDSSLCVDKEVAARSWLVLCSGSGACGEGLSLGRLPE